MSTLKTDFSGASIMVLMVLYNPVYLISLSIFQYPSHKILSKQMSSIFSGIFFSEILNFKFYFRSLDIFARILQKQKFKDT